MEKWDLWQAGGGPFLGADRHHAMMIELARQKPELALARFQQEISAQDDADADGALQQAEWSYADPQYKPYTAEWYDSAYRMDGCAWDLYQSRK